MEPLVLAVQELPTCNVRTLFEPDQGIAVDEVQMHKFVSHPELPLPDPEVRSLRG